jgi:hypothetical protein
MPLLPSKNKAVDAIKKVKAAAEKKSGHELCGLRTDRGESSLQPSSQTTVQSLESGGS